MAESLPHPANRLLFREVNERLRELTDRLASDGDSIDVVCECGSDQCVERLTINRMAYDLIRTTPGHFALKHGHAAPDDSVVEQFASYDVVRTNGGRPPER
jgi:hypothetical protein